MTLLKTFANLTLFKMFGTDNRWLQKRLVKSVVDFNRISPNDYTCPFVDFFWGRAGAKWYSDKLEKYTTGEGERLESNIPFTNIPFTILAIENCTSAKIERAKFLQQLVKEFE